MSDQKEIKPDSQEVPSELSTEALDQEVTSILEEVAALSEQAEQIKTETVTDKLLETDPIAPISDEELEAVATAKPQESKAASTEPFVMEEAAFLSAVEAVLFAADRPAGFERLRSAFGTTAPSDDQLKDAITKIQDRYTASTSGFELRKAQGGYHFVTKVANAEFVRRFQASKPFRLGRSALEVMAIIAYRQPITRSEIDQVRGIDSSHLLRTLIERGLVRMAGKAETPGRPVQYASTQKFLEVVGLANTMELPPLSELNQLQGDVEDPSKRLEEGLEAFMKPLPHSYDGATDTGPATDEDGADPMLTEIEGMIQTADHAPKEVFASALHRDIAAANQEALEAFQAANRRRPRKQALAEEPKAITFEQLTGGSNDGSPPPPVAN